MKELRYTPWFSFSKDGPPIRVGVYEGSNISIPGDGATFQQGYYYWDGERWAGWGTRPDGVERAPFWAEYWRGVIPDEDYPFDQVKTYVPQHFTGVLERIGAAHDKLLVHRLRIRNGEMELQFTRKFGASDAEEYKCLLGKHGGEFSGTARPRIRGFDSEMDVQLRVISLVGEGDSVVVALMLKTPVSEHRQFKGVLRRPT